MEDLLWNHPEKFFHEPLKQFSRQQRSAVGRTDLVFTDRLGRLLVVEVKKGKLGRDAVPQIVDYFGMIKRQFPNKPVELMLVANGIPEERRLACEHYDIDSREISERKFRDVAQEVGYVFESEKTTGVEPERGAVPRRDRERSTGNMRPTGYSLNATFDRGVLERLLNEFESVVRREQDKSVARKLRRELLEQDRQALQRSTVVQLAKWCDTQNPLYWDGMEVARKVSDLLFGRRLDRRDFGA